MNTLFRGALGAPVARLLTAALLLGAVFLTGCTTPHRKVPGQRTFEFGKDTFAFANELRWEYGYDPSGNWTGKAKEPKPEYTLRCFVLARSALQFFHGATFDSRAPVVDGERYRDLVRQVLKVSPGRHAPPAQKIIIPGYADLWSFSRNHSQLLKDECGGARVSYFQRGHWRMVFPFTRRHQQGQAAALLQQIQLGHPSAIHLVRFPGLTINHAMVLFDGKRSGSGILFKAYDPNDPETPAELEFVQATRTFILPRNAYFEGGRVDVYQVYHHWAY